MSAPIQTPNIYSRMSSIGYFYIKWFPLPPSLKLLKLCFSFLEEVPLAIINNHLVIYVPSVQYTTRVYDRLEFLTKCLFYISLSF